MELLTIGMQFNLPWALARQYAYFLPRECPGFKLAGIALSCTGYIAKEGNTCPNMCAVRDHSLLNVSWLNLRSTQAVSLMRKAIERSRLSVCIEV